MSRTWTLRSYLLLLKNKLDFNNNKNIFKFKNELVFTSGENTTCITGYSSANPVLLSGLRFIGFQDGRTHQGTGAVAIGSLEGSFTEVKNTVSIGFNAAKLQQKYLGVEIGYEACLHIKEMKPSQ